MVIGGYFQGWNYIFKKLTENFCQHLMFWIASSEAICSYPSPETFCLYLSVNKDFTVFQNILLSVMSRVLMYTCINIFNIIKFSQRLRCLLYAFLSKSLFVFENLFLSRDFFKFFLFIVLFMKGAWFARTYRWFI